MTSLYVLVGQKFPQICNYHTSEEQDVITNVEVVEPLSD